MSFSLANNEDELKKTLRALQAPASQCIVPRVPPCSSSEIYRRIDGTCTNLKVPFWSVKTKQALILTEFKPFL